MKLERHLKLSQAGDGVLRLRIAFATRDRKHVDQHFGSACSFMIYSITQNGYGLEEVAEFTETEQDRNHSKLLTKLSLLDGCQAVYCTAVGTAAVQQLLSLGTQPIRSLPGTPIAREISQLQDAWKTDPPGWLQKQITLAKRRTQPGNRFDAMEEEGWQE
ncbi:NifB/NifX family molybdenum-iron cluster-binding protein [Motiliproteus sp. SC1-56]|uniref:NifB/NifX family molybdenum-iron cluster-binding protein n=1 Tax=Motiliproteus sp. SC1-56 TaxID=2799565 RepID=UPI001A8E16F2|nr:NifB/NifX family molybdenum-iron cluster-binding protein [Motiliproteus sp. SC1-56]